MELHAVQVVFLLLVVMVAVFAVIAERMRVPYPIVMVLAGLVLSFVPHMPQIHLDPNLVFAVILPPLLYSAAWSTSWREFRENLVTIVLLAVGLVAFTVWGVAEVADHFITALDWKSGFVLGAVVATTDAIAAASIATRVGLPKRVIDILNGESLVNDATGLLALQFGLMIMVRGETPTVGLAVWKLVWLVVGGLGAGLLLGLIVDWCERFVDDGPVEIVLSIVTPYAAYLAGEAAGASGVLSVVTAGLFLSRRSAKFYSPTVRMQSLAVWHAIDFALNGVVFCLIGLQVPYVLAGIKGGYHWTTLVLYGTVFSVVLIALRVVWMYPASSVAWWIRKHIFRQPNEPPPAKGIFVVGWTGMRGVLALAAAFALPETLADGRPFTQRNLIVFLAYVVILVTLVGQGLTLPWVIRKLGLAGMDVETQAEVREARKAVLEAGLAWLERERATDSPRACHFYDDVIHTYTHRLASLSDDAQDDEPAKFSKLVTIEQGATREKRRVLLSLRDSGQIGDEALRTVESELDLLEIQFDNEKTE
jgi:Na+/H+ antiporter